MRSLIDHIRQCLKSSTRLTLRAWEGRPGAMGVSRARASGASEHSGIPVRLLGFERQHFPGTAHDHHMHMDVAAVVVSNESVPDTFPEEWTGGQP